MPTTENTENPQHLYSLDGCTFFHPLCKILYSSALYIYIYVIFVATNLPHKPISCSVVGSGPIRSIPILSNVLKTGMSDTEI